MQYTVKPVGTLQANAYVLYQPERDDALVIDPGAEPEIIHAMLDGRRLSGIVLTHGHFDHIGAVSSLRSADAPVYIHRADADMLTRPDLNLAYLMQQTSDCGAADVLLEEGDITISGIRFQVLHTPGHTPGSICLRCGMDLFTGDTLFCRGYGRTDLPGGNAQQIRQSIRRLLSLDPGLRVHPGHGPSTTISAENEVYGR